METITVKTNNGPENVPCACRVNAVGHDFAVARSGKDWNLTHVETGLRLCFLPRLGRGKKVSKQTARELAESKLKAYVSSYGAERFAQALEANINKR